MKVLVVDDEAVSRHLVCSLVSRWGYEVVAASNAEEALGELSLPHAPRLVIADWLMPGTDGLELVHRIKERNNAPYTFCLLLTARNTPEDIETVVLNGGDDYVAKPFHPTELKARLAAGERTVNLTDEMHKAYRSAHENEQRYRNLFEHATDAIFITDVSGRMIDMNHAAEELLGRQRTLSVGVPFAAIFNSDGWDAVQQQAKEQRSPAQPVTIAGEFNGKSRTLECNCRMLQTLSKAGIQVIARDVTARIEAEQALHQVQKIEAVGRLAGGIAHDFNNILMAIQGYADLLKESSATGTIPSKYIDEIVNAARRGSSLTSQLLAYGRKQLVQHKVMDLRSVVLNATGMLRRLLREDIRFDVNTTECPAWFTGDATQIEQVLLNLVVNSRDAMPSGGDLSVSLAVRKLEELRPKYDFLKEPEYLSLCVADTGCGMNDTVKQHVFEPFFTTKPKGHGTGLGLATVYAIVKQNGGYIDIESHVDQGTRVEVLLPSRGCGNAEAGTAMDLPASGGPERILLVEDEDQVRNPVSEFLTTCGYTVIAAPNGCEALRLCPDANVDLVISDVVMPGLSGPQTTEKLRRLNPKLKVLFISGYTDDTLDASGLSQSHFELLEKPFKLSDLKARVRQVLDAQTAPAGELPMAALPG